MAKGDKLDNAHTFARYCKGSRVFDDGKPMSAAFLLRRNAEGGLDEDALSGGCLEKYASSRDEQFRQLRIGIGLKYRGRDRFAFLGIGSAIAFVRENTSDARVLRFLHDPEPDHEAHSAIYDTFKDEERIAELLAKSVHETVLALES